MADSLDSEGFGLRTNGGSSDDVGTPPPSLGELERQAAFTRDIDDFLRNGEPQSSAYSRESAANAPDNTNDAYSRGIQARHLLQVQGFLDTGNGRTSRESRTALPADGVAGAILGSMPGRGLASPSAQGDDSWQYDGKRDSSSAMVFPEDNALRKSGRYEDNPLAGDGGSNRMDARKSWEEEWPGPNALAQAGETYGSPQDLVKPVKAGGHGRYCERINELPSVSAEEDRQRSERENWLQEKGLTPVPPSSGEVTSEIQLEGRLRPNKNVIRPHKGIDISNPLNDPVRASDSGTITSIGRYSTGENYVVIRHRDGSESTYLHIKPEVKPGDYVTAGRSIGRTDLSGDPSGPHVHYEYRVTPGGNPINPRQHIALPPLRK